VLSAIGAGSMSAWGIAPGFGRAKATRAASAIQLRGRFDPIDGSRARPAGLKRVFRACLAFDLSPWALPQAEGEYCAIGAKEVMPSVIRAVGVIG
jgi:hypothetical protein